MKISSAAFVKSSTTLEQCPVGKLPEYAFIGRSNVGKSSLINMLTGFKGLALTSSKPGKTLLLNHFLVNEQWHLVDLPGYGYAKISKTERARIKTMNESYILNSTQLTNLFVLIDSRIEAQKVDLEFINWLGEKGIPFCIVFTKTDKLKKLHLKNNISAYKAKLEEIWEELPPLFLSSAETKLGREEILKYIEEINFSLK